MKEFKFLDQPTGKTYHGKVGKASHLSSTWKWGVLVNDAGDVVLFKTQKAVVAYVHYRWGTLANFVMTRYCARGSKA